MIKILPFVLIPIIIAGVVFWRFTAAQKLETPKQGGSEPVEVPKTLPSEPLDEPDISPKPTVKGSPSSQTDSSLDKRLKDAEGAITELKARISSLEKSSKSTTTTTTSSGVTTYIPLGSGGSWGNKDWYSLVEYEVSLDPANFPGYKNMELEVTFRLSEAAGTGYIRLFNITDNQATSGEVTTTSTSYSLKTTSTFTIPAGTKVYRLQIKSSEGKDLFIQSARIKVNF
ncbi:hypothetical protein HYS94_01110 [Candidatus Daviesbacteria bacterium]|nr:hypothetical protein [Candidatus Daviesbacteria bacterium]